MKNTVYFCIKTKKQNEINMKCKNKRERRMDMKEFCVGLKEEEKNQ